MGGASTAETLAHKKPKKADYRQRAHCNPLADSFLAYPPSPEFVDWSMHFPGPLGVASPPRLCLNTTDYPIKYEAPVAAERNGESGRSPDFLDVGCGFGGLLISLAPQFPQSLIMGLEIREKVTNFVGERIQALREEHKEEGLYQNVSVIRTNATKFLLNYFRKGQISKMFFCFPDPHFKRTNWRRRIINTPLLTLYGYIMKPGGLLYTITDVEAVHHWMVHALRHHPLFAEQSLEALSGDPCLVAIQNHTEEGMKAITCDAVCLPAGKLAACLEPQFGCASNQSSGGSNEMRLTAILKALLSPTLRGSSWTRLVMGKNLGALTTAWPQKVEATQSLFSLAALALHAASFNAARKL
ncbi:tRNA (guanine-N(7)-)-methyltransferase [Cyclospora cayetanensis]|uniref:tRNA (guanine-N(7)-)-methyltransferase n=1 Tax=Cyclospora cayetanensis TaxID=88456 RepID=A0A6P6S124_9EIME|nr:tRNA (guanine-N(7)-)-methyltransferase [Cyclospora cayetanensis]